MDFHVPGPCVLKFGAIATPATTIGTTKAGVIISSQMIWTPIYADEYGGAPVDWIFGGRNMTIACVINNIIAFTDGFFKGNIGRQASANIGEVEAAIDSSVSALHIEERTASDLWVAAHVVPMDPSEMLLSATAELEVPIVFKVLPGNTTGKIGAHFDTIPAYLTTTPEA